MSAVDRSAAAAQRSGYRTFGNPLLAELRMSGRPLASFERLGSGAPTLFPTGDVPRATASGNPPSQLLELPWQLRHAAAEADQAEWARLFREYGPGCDDPAVAMMYEPAAMHPGNFDYEARFRAWRQTGPTAARR